MLVVDSLLPKNAFAHRSFILFTTRCSLSRYSSWFTLLFRFAVTLAFSYLKSKIAFKHSLVNSDKDHCQTLAGRLSVNSISKLAIPTCALADINAPMIAHLIFADNSLIHMEANEETYHGLVL
jgi:hypothetical protein